MNIATHDAFQDGYRALLARAAEQENARLAEVLGCNLMSAKRAAMAAPAPTPPEVFIRSVASRQRTGATFAQVCADTPGLDPKTVGRRLRGLWRAGILDRELTGAGATLAYFVVLPGVC